MRLAHERWQTWKGSEQGGHVQSCKFSTAQETSTRGNRTEIQPGLACQAVPLTWAACHSEGAPFVDLHKCAPRRPAPAQGGHLYLAFTNHHQCPLWSSRCLPCLEQKPLPQKIEFSSADWLLAHRDAQPCPPGSPSLLDHLHRSFLLVTQCQSLWVMSLEPGGHGHSRPCKILALDFPAHHAGAPAQPENPPPCRGQGDI